MGTIKQTFFLEDDNGNIVYEGKMKKFSLFLASPYSFTNFITNKTEEHKIGKTITAEESGLASMLSTKSYFKYDGKNIWDYLHEKGIRINSTLSSDKIGMTHSISFEGKEIATMKSTTPKGKSFITTNLYYDVFCDEKDLDLVFLVAFSIGKTHQTFYS